MSQLVPGALTEGGDELRSTHLCLRPASAVEEVLQDQALLAIPPRALHLGLFLQPCFASDWCKLIISETSNWWLFLVQLFVQSRAEWRLAAEQHHVSSQEGRLEQGVDSIPGVIDEARKAFVCFFGQCWKMQHSISLLFYWVLIECSCVLRCSMGSSKLSCVCDALEKHFWGDGSDSSRLLESCSAVELLSWNIWPQTGSLWKVHCLCLGWEGRPVRN